MIRYRLQHAWLRVKLFTLTIVRNVKHGFMVFKYTKLIPWFDKNKGHAFFKFFENADWFKWYGKKVVYVQPKQNLTATEQDVKDAINAKDYQKALDIVSELPVTARSVALKQVIEAKLT